MGICEGAILFLKLIKQTDILDGNDGLVGEGLKELDLNLREGSGGIPRYRDRPNGPAVTEHRYAQHASQAGRCSEVEVVFRILQNIGDVYGTSIEDRSAVRGPPSRGAGEQLGDRFGSTKSGIVL